MRRIAMLMLILAIAFPLLVQVAAAQGPEVELFVKGAQTIKSIYDAASGIWPHKWVVIEYADGYCIFNRFRAKRTMRDVLDHAMGAGDCDWWEWPEEANRHVCLDSYGKARALAQAHGGILDIRWIDHPVPPQRREKPRPSPSSAVPPPMPPAQNVPGEAILYISNRTGRCIDVYVSAYAEFATGGRHWTPVIGPFRFMPHQSAPMSLHDVNTDWDVKGEWAHLWAEACDGQGVWNAYQTTPLYLLGQGGAEFLFTFVP